MKGFASFHEGLDSAMYPFQGAPNVLHSAN